jgi:nuclear pore complex protein Nup133
MFAQEDVQGTYLDNFFADHPDPNISWIHDVRKRRFTHAASSLFTEAVEASELSEKQVCFTYRSKDILILTCLLQLMLSIGKLAHLAQAQEPGLEGAVDMRTLDGGFPSRYRVLPG